MTFDPTLPLHIRNATQLLRAMKASKLTPQQVAEALHTALYLLGRGNGLSTAQMITMFTQEMQLLETNTVFATRTPQ